MASRFLILILVIVLLFPSAAKRTSVLHRIGALGIAIATVIPSQAVFALPTAEDYVATGVNEFKLGHLKQSVEAFDKAIELKKELEPYLWQRGLALYFENRFEECERQFAIDVSVNPRDTEESIWNYLCQSDDGIGKTRSLIRLEGADSRPVMQTAYNLFKGDVSWEKLKDVGDTLGVQPFFYSRLYLSLYFHSMRDETRTIFFVNQAVNSDYFRSVGDRDLMVIVAQLLKSKTSNS